MTVGNTKDAHAEADADVDGGIDADIDDVDGIDDLDDLDDVDDLDDGAYTRPEVRPSLKALAWLLTIGGAIGLFASFILAVERVDLLQDPSKSLSCDFNPIITCGQVMESWQGELFGFPNPFLGIAAFSIVVTLGVVALSGGQVARWVWNGLWLGTLGGAVLVTWLFTQSVYLISALCPYCMVVWTVTIPIFVYTTGYVLGERYLPAPAWLRRTVVENRGLITMLWYLIIAALITIEFWDRWHIVF
jgi:uncharacterized membrane protein